MRRLFSHRDARTYIAGQSLSVIGDSALWLAMGIWVKILTGSNSAAGLTFFAFACGCMSAPVSGVIADRVRRALPYVPAERLVLAPDCGMKYLPRDAAYGKLAAMAQAAAVLRAEAG